MLGGVGIDYFLLSRVTGGWFLPLAIIMAMTCAFFVFDAAGATFGIAPLIKRWVTGNLAGNVGAYGSVGSVIYATIYSLLPQTTAGNRTFFEVLGVAGIIVCLLCAFILKEPQIAASKEFQDAAAVVGH